MLFLFLFEAPGGLSRGSGLHPQTRSYLGRPRPSTRVLGRVGASAGVDGDEAEPGAAENAGAVFGPQNRFHENWVTAMGAAMGAAMGLILFFRASPRMVENEFRQLKAVGT